MTYIVSGGALNYSLTHYTLCTIYYVASHVDDTPTGRYTIGWQK